MALDTLEVFGREYTNVKGFKATDDNGNTKAYIRPQGIYTVTGAAPSTDISEYRLLTVNRRDINYPTAIKSTVSNHSVNVTPVVTVNIAGFASAGSTQGAAVTVSASELVSGSQTITTNNTYDVTNLAEVVVNVSGGSGKNAQVVQSTSRVASTSYVKACGDITVAKTGTYDVYWSCFRSSTSGTSGSQLYINDSAYGSANTTFTNNIQSIHLSNVSLTKDQTVAVYARSRGSSYYSYVGTLTIIEA